MRGIRISGAWLTSACLLLAAQVVPSGQQPPGPLTEAELASVDFMATGPDGRPVKDLAAGDVALRVDGRDRAIQAMQYVELAGTEPPVSGSGPARPLPLPFGSNMLADAGRAVMVVVNHETITPGKERPVRDAAIRFLDALSPYDRVGVITMPRGGIVVELTRDREQVRSALMKITGQAPQTDGQSLPAATRMRGMSAGQMAASDRACTARLTLNALAGMLGPMVPIEAPKTIVFISSGLVPPTRDAPMTSAPGPCELRLEHFDEVGVAARAARARFYVVQPSDLVADPPSNAFTDVTASRFAGADDMLAGLQSLAGVTGGDLFRLSGSADAVFAQIARESSGYYLIDFVPDPEERNGLPHRVEIRARRPDVKLRYQGQLVLWKPQPRRDPKFLSPHDMLRGVRRFRTLPLRAMAYASKMPDSAELKVVAVAEPFDPSVPITSAAMALVDSRNRLVKQWTAEKADLDAGTLLAAFPAPAGAYRLRVAAIDAKGRHGTVEYPFLAELGSAGAFRLSTMVLGVSRQNNFEPRMVFGSEATAIAYVELYGRAAEPVVRIEVAETEDGPALLSVQARTTGTRDPERRVSIGALPIASLFPGDYIVRAVVTNDGRPLGRTTRTLRKIMVP